ncbi:MAG: response regulator [Chitinispirillaceae bacterium]|nr:response regulator [Chitinispirillaceae bacterium]
MSPLQSKRRTSLASSIIWRFVLYSTIPVAASGTLFLFLVMQSGKGSRSIPEEGLTIFFVTLLAAFGILSAIGGWFFARWLSRLFAYLSHNARRVAEGDYSTTIPLQRHIEMEELADNIRSMVSAVREREEQYRELNQETRRNLLFQRTLLEAINLPMVYYNLQGDPLGCNSRFEEVMGVTRDRLLHLQDMKDAPEPFRRLMAELMKSGGRENAHTFERELLLNDGRIHTIIIHRAPYFLEEGSIDGYVCALLDITEYRLTEDAFQRLIQSTVGVHGVDFFHRIVRLLCDWIGCDGALVGEVPSQKECRVLSMLLNGLRVDEYTFNLEHSPARQAIAKGFFSVEENVCEQFPLDNELKRLGITGYAAVALEADDGTVLGILELFSRSPLRLPSMARGSMEILAAMAASEILRIRAEREQIKLEAQLRQMEKMEAVGQLAGGIAHDINNQLGCILGYADIIQDVNEQPGISEFISRIHQAVSRSADLVKKLLAFSRHGNFVMKPVNMTAVVHEVVGLLQHSVDKSISLSLIAADGQLHVMGDPGQLQNALLNLGLNSRDALPDGGTITYEIHAVEVCEEEQGDYPSCQCGSYVCLKVHDTGVGMSPEVASRIFEPFYTTKPEGKGTGLGLAAVYGTISSHRGYIDVKSAAGVGTDFTILIPRYNAPVPVCTEEPAAPAVFGAGTVLVIDDEIDIRDTVALALRKCGFTVITAGDGLEGVQLFIKYTGKIDLVILDMVLPGIDGKSTFEQLVELDPAVKVIIVSGYTVDGRVQSVLDQGARSFLQKPFRNVDMLRMVSDVLGMDVAADK